MSDMMDDIEKYSKIWDAALEKGIFPDTPKAKPASEEDSFFGADFFGQNRSAEYDVDAPMNEVDTKYWDKVSRMADHSKKYVDPLMEEDDKNFVKKMANAHNPVEAQGLGKDQEVAVTQNWGVGGKEITQLEELKVRLEKLESKLNAIESEGNSGKTTQDKIDSLKNQIDNLSDSLSGDRFSEDG
jgi:hypothetical protein